MRNRRRTERRPCARLLRSRVAAALSAVLLLGGLVACTPAADGSEPRPTVRVSAVDVAPSAEYTAALERGLSVRDDALALLTATDGVVEGTIRTTLLSSVSALNDALGGVSASAITDATATTLERQAAVADRLLGLGAATLAAGRGSSTRRAALTDAMDQLRSTVDAGSALAGAAQAVLDARDPLVPPPGSGGFPAPRPPAAPTAAPPAPPAPAAPEPTAAPVEPTSEPEPEPQPDPVVPEEPEPSPSPVDPEPTAEPQPPVVVPPPDCSNDPRLCPPAPTPTIGDPET